MRKSRAQRLFDKLEAYELKAYDAGIGQDWLAEIGEGFKFYVQDCIKKGLPVMIAGFERFIDEKARGMLN